MGRRRKGRRKGGRKGQEQEQEQEQEQVRAVFPCVISQCLVPASASRMVTCLSAPLCLAGTGTWERMCMRCVYLCECLIDGVQVLGTTGAVGRWRQHWVGLQLVSRQSLHTLAV